MVASLPPVWVLDTGPDLDLYWQLGGKPTSGEGGQRVHVRAMVVNRGGGTAFGLIELTISYNHTDRHVRNATPEITDYPLAECERIDGFGSWNVDSNVTIRDWEQGNRTPMITLSINGRELETQKLRIPAANPLLALAAVLFIKALSDRWRGRGRRPVTNTFIPSST